MAATNKLYLDSVGLETLIGKIKNHITNEAANKVQEIKYDSTNKTLKWTKDGSTYTDINVTSWVSDIYLNSIALSTSTGVITLTLNNNTTKTIDLKSWFDPSKYVTVTLASNTYLKIATAASTYLSKTTATNTYITSIQTLSTTEVDTLWG